MHLQEKLGILQLVHKGSDECNRCHNQILLIGLNEHDIGEFAFVACRVSPQVQPGEDQVDGRADKGRHRMNRTEKEDVEQVVDREDVLNGDRVTIHRLFHYPRLIVQEQRVETHLDDAVQG